MRNSTGYSSFFCSKSILAITLLLLGFIQPSQAGQITYGPFPDFRGFVNQTVQVTIPTQGTFTIHIPFDGNIRVRFTDSIRVRVTVPVPVFAATYITVSVVGDPTLEPDAVLTDLWALDLDGSLGGPDNDVPLLTGFDPLDPQIVPLSQEDFIGNSGTIYGASVQAVRLSDLQTLLPEFDLSRFIGDPNSVVYLAQTTVPLDDVATLEPVPEPATLALFGIGAFALVGYESRRRKLERSITLTR